MTDPKTTPTAADALPLPTDEVHAALRSGILRVTAGKDHEDLLQDAWVALLERLPKLDGVKIDALPAYVSRIGHSAAIDSLRLQAAVKRGGRTRFVHMDVDAAVPAHSPDPENAALSRVDLRKAVLRATRPGTRSRGILALLLLHGLDAEAVAAQLGMHRNSVYGTLSRARKRLNHGGTPDRGSSVL